MTPHQSPLAVTAVHDESGNYGADRYFATGFVFVLDEHVEAVLAALRAAREENDYWGEIHYSKITQGSAKYRTALDWMVIAEGEMASGHVRAKVLSVDTHAPGFEHDRFRRRPHHAYNRFTRMVLESGLSWCFCADADILDVRVLSDEKSRRYGGDDEDPSATDNFDTYLPRATNPSYVSARFVPPRVELVSPGDWHQECDTACELVQLADLIISSTAAAIRGPSRKRQKLRLARIAAEWVCSSELDRRFGASVYAPPDWLDPVPIVRSRTEPAEVSA